MNYSERFSSKFFARLLKPEGQNPIRDRATSFEIIFEPLYFSGVFSKKKKPTTRELKKALRVVPLDTASQT